ncbi:hypothetical protein ACF1GP_28175 [Kitasatospora aureofaciens]
MQPGDTLNSIATAHGKPWCRRSERWHKASVGGGGVSRG